MDFKFDKGPAADAATQGQDKGRQTILLVVLLLLLGGFGYLYFFTGLIRPQEQPAPPQPAPQVVKQPLPARDGAPVQPQPAAPGTAPTTPTATPASPVAAAKPAATPQPVQAPPATVKPAPATPAAVVPPKPAVPAAKPAEKQSAVVAKPASPKSVPVAKAESPKTVAAAAKPAPVVQATVKKIPAAKPAAKRATAVKTGGPWTLVVGSYVVEERLAADMARVKGVGLTPAMTSGQRRMTIMHRLKYGEYADRAAAQQAVELLKQKAGDGFAIQKGGKHEVFAGSYAQLESAQAEQQRLSAAGIKVSIQKSQVGLPTRKLTAGTFTDRAAAEAALKKLKQSGVGTPVLE